MSRSTSRSTSSPSPQCGQLRRLSSCCSCGVVVGAGKHGRQTTRMGGPASRLLGRAVLQIAMPHAQFGVALACPPAAAWHYLPPFMQQQIGWVKQKLQLAMADQHSAAAAVSCTRCPCCAAGACRQAERAARPLPLLDLCGGVGP